LTRQKVQYRVKRAAQRAHVREGVHLLRHTFCSHLAMKGAPGRAIQELAGHTELSTTQRYPHLSPAALDAAIWLLDAPAVTMRGAERDPSSGVVEKARPLRALRSSSLVLPDSPQSSMAVTHRGIRKIASFGPVDRLRVGD